MVRAAFAADPTVRVVVDETRPLLQGARLTAWELEREGIPYTLIADSMAASMMASGRVSHVVVGADRIAANGDVVNKIGTYGLAILAREHGIPMIVAAPTTTLDLSTPAGAGVVIEERAADEVRGLGLFGRPAAPEAANVANPAFDVTPGAAGVGDRDRGGGAPPAVRALAARGPRRGLVTLPARSARHARARPAQPGAWPSDASSTCSSRRRARPAGSRARPPAPAASGRWRP